MINPQFKHAKFSLKNIKLELSIKLNSDEIRFNFGEVHFIIYPIFVVNLNFVEFTRTIVKFWF